MDYQKTEFEGAKIDAPKPAPPPVYRATIWKEIRSWGMYLLFVGAILILITGFLNAPWGVVLIIVGLASFYFRSAAMLVVYGVALAFAGLSNVFSGQVLWIANAIFQWVLTFFVFRRFLRFRRLEASSTEEDIVSSNLTPQRSAKVFPWAAGILGVFSVCGLVSIIVGSIIVASRLGSLPNRELTIFSENLIVYLGVLGFALGLASVLSKHPNRPLAILGMVTGLLPLAIEFGFRIARLL